jgi:hypothetical protein
VQYSKRFLNELLTGAVEQRGPLGAGPGGARRSTPHDRRVAPVSKIRRDFSAYRSGALCLIESFGW